MTQGFGQSFGGWVAAAALVALLAGPARLAAQNGEAGQEGGGRQGGVAGGQMVRGTVTAVAADHLTVKTETGESFEVVWTANTRLMKERQPVKPSEIHVGDGVGAAGVLDEPKKTVHALMVMVVDAEQIKKAREAMGKTYIVGKVTAIDADNLKLTILRQDGVSQVIAVDDGTSFKRGGRGPAGMGSGLGSGAGNGAGAGRQGPAEESITLADMKVGDNVAGPGAVKSGVFVPTELHVRTPGAGRGRQRGGEPGAGMAPPGPGVAGTGAAGGPPPAEPR